MALTQLIPRAFLLIESVCSYYLYDFKPMKVNQRPWSKQTLNRSRTKVRKEGSCEAEDSGEKGTRFGFMRLQGSLRKGMAFLTGSICLYFPFHLFLFTVKEGLLPSTVPHPEGGPGLPIRWRSQTTLKEISFPPPQLRPSRFPQGKLAPSRRAPQPPGPFSKTVMHRFPALAPFQDKRALKSIRDSGTPPCNASR